MPIELKPFRELIAMSKEKLNEAMAPLRARAVKSQADLEMTKLEGDIIALQAAIQEMCVDKEIDFAALFDKLDDIALLERRLKQYEDVLAQLFPEDVAKAAA